MPDTGRDRVVRVAAVGDLHFDGSASGAMADLISAVNREADVLVLCGDMTAHGRAAEMRAFVHELEAVEVPVVAVLGNHDYESEEEDELRGVLEARGVHLLDGDHAVVDGVGFAGTKGFAGGFGRGTLAPFGEKLIKDFVDAALAESLKLERALRALQTELKIVAMHYSPIVETLEGEPECIHPFLGSSRLREPLDTYGATVVFHGHAHHGSLEGRTAGGVPVYNAALPLLKEHGRLFQLWTAEAPERRREGA